MARPRREVVRAESVHDEHDRAPRGREPLRGAVQSRDHLRHDTGEAPGSRRVRG